MTEEIKEIKWQFAEEFYKLLIKQLDRINMLITYQKDYEHGYGELLQITNNLDYTYKTFAPESHKMIQDLKGQIEKLLYDYNVKQVILERHDCRRHRIRLFAIEKDLREKINNLHMLVMGTNDRLGMLFPRDKIDTRLPIFGGQK